MNIANLLVADGLTLIEVIYHCLFALTSILFLIDPKLQKNRKVIRGFNIYWILLLVFKLFFGNWMNLFFHLFLAIPVFILSLKNKAETIPKGGN